MNRQPQIGRIDPPFWFAGMKRTQLQLMVYGPGIGRADVEACGSGASVGRVVRPDSPNYIFVYLDLAGAAPGHIRLRFSTPGGSACVQYELRKRTMDGSRRTGFSCADVLYMLMPDRFAAARCPTDEAALRRLAPYTVDRTQPSLRHGGNLEGIRRRLPYIADLGATALWLTPVLENNSPDCGRHSTYHGYATTDYYRIDPRLGSNADYRRLVDEAHRLGLKVVMDMIFNHCSADHPWMADPPTPDWFNSAGGQYVQTSYRLTPVLDPYASQADRRQTVDGWFVPTMPDLNQRNSLLMDYLTQNSMWWIETAGIDGIRMDTYPYADRQAMAQWMAAINDEYPNLNTVGETWVAEPAYTAAWQKDSKLSAVNSNLKTVMDFALFDRLNQAKNEETDNWASGLNRIYNTLCYDYLYADPSNVLAFADNHDTDRFLGDGHDAAALRQALALLLTIKRTPQIYYGTEIMMSGTKAATDGNVRRDFPGGFPGDRRNAFVRSGRTREEQAMFGFVRRLLHWRRGNAVIASGRQTQFVPYNGVYVVARTLGQRAVLTVLNGTSHWAVMHTARYDEIVCGRRWATNIITGRRVGLEKDIRLAPRAAMILEVLQ